MKTSQTQKLQNYLIGLGGVSLLASTSNAAVFTMDISSISGPNAGVPVGGQAYVDLSTLDSGLIGIFNIPNKPANNLVGVSGHKVGAGNETMIAKSGSDPKRFGSGETIDATAGTFTSGYQGLFFYGAGNKVPAWNAGSYLGFKSGNNRYGYLEVTWNPDTDTFQILSGAYESVENAGITTPIPEPEASTLALLVAGAGAVVALRRRKAVAEE